MKKNHGLLLGSGLLLSALAGASFSLKNTTSYQKVAAAGEDIIYIGGQQISIEDGTTKPVYGNSGSVTIGKNSHSYTFAFNNFILTGAGYTNDDAKVNASIYIDIKSGRDVIVSFFNNSVITNTFSVSGTDYFSYGMYFSVVENQKIIIQEYASDYDHSLVINGTSGSYITTVGLGLHGESYFGNPNDLSSAGPDITINRIEDCKGKSSYGIKSDGHLHFLSGKIEAYGGNHSVGTYGLYSEGQVSITGDDTNLTFNGGTYDYLASYGLYSEDNVYVNGGVTHIEGKDYGIDLSSDKFVNVSSIAGEFTVIGGVGAFRNKTNNQLKNSIKGHSYTNAEGTQGRAEVEINTSGSPVAETAKKLTFKEIVYTAEEAGTVTYTGSEFTSVNIGIIYPTTGAIVRYRTTSTGDYSIESVPKRTNAGRIDVYYKIYCPNDEDFEPQYGQAYLDISKATGEVDQEAVGATDLSYDGSTHDLLTTLPTAKASGTIEYRVNDAESFETTAPTAIDAGNYKIDYRMQADENHTASDIKTLNVSIAKAAGTVASEAVVATNLVYNGKSQHLFSVAPTADLNGTIEYRINDAELFTTNEPTSIDAGTFKIEYRVKEDTNHTASELYTVNVSIAKATNSYTSEPRIFFDNYYTGEEKPLVTEGAAYSGTVYYKVDDGEYSTDVPTRTDVGKYVVYYKVDGGNNYMDIEESSLNASISPVSKNSLINLIKTAEAYSEEIAEEAPSIATALNEVISEAIVVRDEVNKTSVEVNSSRLSLQNAIDNAQASFVMARIDKIPNPVVLTDECYALMTSANEAYQKLSQSVKTKVTNYSLLTGGNVRFVKLAIDNIGEVVYSEEFQAKIEVVRGYYNAINGTEKSLITNYSTLQDAEKTYAKLKEDYTAANKVIALIDDIGDYTYTDAFKTKIAKVRTSFEALTSDQKALVSNISVLDNAELFYNQIENAIKKINAIGTVKYPSSEKAILDARTAYDALSEEQKAFVDNAETLEKDELFFNQIDNAFDLIEAIGEVKYPDSEKAIADAKEAYDALTDEQKEFVTNYNTLMDARTFYDQIDTTFKRINAIGEVKYPDSEKAIADARSSYNNLADAQKAFVDEDTYNILLNAEATYKKISDDHKEADSVTSLIKRIGKVEYTTPCKNRINNAREAYDALTNDAQRGYVSNYETLTAAESLYASLKVNYDAANEVASLINSIDEVNLNNDCKAKIEEARNKYNALNEEQKALVKLDVYETLVNAENTYTGLNNNRRNWTIAGVGAGGLVLVLALIYSLSFFVFNKWALVDGEVIRVVKIGKKYGANKMLAMPFKVIYCENDIIFKKKQDAINKQSSK